VLRQTLYYFDDRERNLQPYSKSKLELNSKKSNSSDAKNFSSVLIFFFFAVKARLQVLKIELFHLKLAFNHE